MSEYDPQVAGARCWECPLRGEKVVPPKGCLDPDAVICGEGPGMNEVKQGAPFVGPSGVKLNEMLKAAGQKRERMWVTNAVLCRCDTPGVSGAKRYEVKTYLAWLKLYNRQAKKQAKATGEPYIEVPSPFDCCAPRLWNELNYFERIARARGDVNGLVTIPMGNFALKAIAGKTGVMKQRGSPIPVVGGLR